MNREEPTPATPSSFDALLDVSMPVWVEIGRTRMTIAEVLALAPGAVVELERLVGEPADVYVGERRFAEGEIVTVEDRLGVRFTRVLATGPHGIDA